MARWKASNNFIEEVAIKMLNTTVYMQNKNNFANTILHDKMGKDFFEEMQQLFICSSWLL